jgi:putative sigma-54 modulation protein
MNVAITARGYKAPQRLQTYINDKLKRLERFSDQILSFEAILSYEKLDQVAEFKLKLNNKNIIIKEKSDDIFKSCDLAIDSLERQIAKIKSKTHDHNKHKIVEKLEQ